MNLLNKCFVFLFCLLCGCSKQVVTTKGTIDKKIQDEIISEYNALPEPLKKECKSIVLCDLDSFEINDEEIAAFKKELNNMGIEELLEIYKEIYVASKRIL